MKACKRCGQEKPLSAFSPRADARDGLSYWCTPCKTEATTNGPQRKRVVAAYRARNAEACAQRVAISTSKRADWYKAQARDRAARRLAEQPEHVAAVRKAGYTRNRSTEIARVRLRKKRMTLTPLWVAQPQQAEMQGCYQFCRIFPIFEVDHIIPLNGKAVSGLHVPENLQVLTVRANRQKGAKYEVV